VANDHGERGRSKLRGVGKTQASELRKGEGKKMKQQFVMNVLRNINRVLPYDLLV
jgi:hypothetical protein